MSKLLTQCTQALKTPAEMSCLWTSNPMITKTFACHTRLKMDLGRVQPHSKGVLTTLLSLACHRKLNPMGFVRHFIYLLVIT